MRTSDRVSIASRSPHPESRSILIAVEPPSFQRLIEHVLHGQSGLRVVGLSLEGRSPANQAARLAPDVIIVNHRLCRRDQRDVLIDLRRVSPCSTLILLTHSLAESEPPKVADASLPEDAVVRQLLPVIRKAVPRTPCQTLRPASAGLRV
jgi:DNA-binding NarL/FixJ family response regulator